MKKVITAFVILFVISCVSFAQVETFDLSKFKLPYLKYQSLDLNFNTNNQSQSDSWKDTSDYKYNYNNIYTYLNVGGSYYLYKNTAMEQSTYSFGTNISLYPIIGNTSLYDDESIERNSSSNLYMQLNGSTRNRIYFNSPFFFEIGPNVGIFYYRDFNKYTYKDEEGNVTFEHKSIANQPEIRTTLEFGLGYGRIEQVTDAQMALFILKDLKKENRLTREPTHEEIYKLAELISQKRNQRFFDSRHRTINEVKAIDTFLTSQGLSEQTDASYFTTIYDNWLYSNNPNRASGFRVSGGPKVAYTIYNYNNSWELLEPMQDDNEITSKGSFLEYGAWLNVLDEKPINHFWQRTLSAIFTYTLIKNTSALNDDPTYKRLQDNFEVNLNASIGYYPTTRTYLKFGLGTGMRVNNMDKYYYLADTDYDDDQSAYLRIYAGPNANGYYYFSPKLRLNFSGSLTYNFYNTDNFSLISPPAGFGFN
ncbi:MAG: hypothetical protein CVT98_08710, partial [Bacteroidetes bacterium HGW-Bacteroidetes-15]